MDKLAVGTKVEVIGQQYDAMNSIGYQGFIEEEIDGVDRPYHLNNNYCYSREELEELPVFSKADLKNGMLVQTKDDDWYMVMREATVEGEIMDMLICASDRGYLDIKDYTNDLKDVDNEDQFDIVRVATVEDPTEIFEVLREGSPVEYCEDFKIIWTREDPRVVELKETISKLQEQLKTAQDELEAM